MKSPLILTLQLDPHSFDIFTTLRNQHFPPARNIVPAHLTLFHALPGEQESIIQQSLADYCSHTPVLSLTFPGVRFLGNGVAIDVDCSKLVQLRRSLAQNWNHWLTNQDQQSYRPHITIQNKVTADEARSLHTQLTNDWKPFGGSGEGLLLWYYLGGPWELASEFDFQG